jgi:Kef-type K+ transport system membrane component KefB
MALEMLLIGLGLLLLFAKLLGEITEHFGISSLVGQLFAGIILGPLAGIVAIGNFANILITFGIIILLFLAGLQVKFGDIKINTYMASALAIGGGLVSFFLGALVGVVFYHSILVGFAIGTILISTSDVILIALLTKTRQFNTRTGKLIISASIADDILGLLTLSLFSVFAAHEALSFNKISALFFIAIGMYLIVMTAGERLVRQMLRIFSKFHDEQILLSIPVALTFILAFATDHLELSLAAGAFLGGMTMANSEFSSIIEAKTKTIGYGFLIPIFYASIGTLLVLNNINPVLVIAIVVVALAGKFIGCALIAKAAGMRGDEIKLIGVSLIPRGNENIAVAELVFALGVISVAVYTSVIFAIIATVIISPVLLKLFD